MQASKVVGTSRWEEDGWILRREVLVVGPLVANVGWGLVGPNNEEGIARLGIERTLEISMSIFHFHSFNLCSSKMQLLPRDSGEKKDYLELDMLELSHAPSLWCVH